MTILIGDECIGVRIFGEKFFVAYEVSRINFLKKLLEVKWTLVDGMGKMGMSKYILEIMNTRSNG